jgi:hypothetical protein
MLRVRKTSTRGFVREFRFRYKFKRRTGVITLGNFPGLSLADARARAQRFRDLLQEGIDPRSAMNRTAGCRRSACHEQFPQRGGADKGLHRAALASAPQHRSTRNNPPGKE